MTVSRDAFPVRRAGEGAIVVLPAEIDVTNADQVGVELTRVLEAGTVMLVVDMTETVFCDSAGIQKAGRCDNREPLRVMQSHRQAGRVGAPREERPAHGQPPFLRRVLELTGTDQVIDTYPDLNAAMDGVAEIG